MCLIAIAYNSHPDYPLLVAANRDEYYQRPTAAAQFWPESPGLLAGKDLQAGGTWMGITRSGRFAAITNHRNPPTTPAQPRSRGLLTLDYLRGTQHPAAYLEAIAADADSYAGFNLLLANAQGLYYYSNIENEVQVLPAGIYSLSNASLHSGWPKQQLAMENLRGVIESGVGHSQLHATVGDQTPAADISLPETGLGTAMERLLSAQFITGDIYGTRATTSCWLDREGIVEWSESSYLPGGEPGGSAQFRFSLAGRE